MKKNKKAVLLIKERSGKFLFHEYAEDEEHKNM